jgi:ribosome recycling factor
MNDLIKKQLQDAQATMDKAILFCESELTKIRAGKATVGMLDGIMEILRH